MKGGGGKGVSQCGITNITRNIYRHMLEIERDETEGKLTKNKSHDDPKSSLMSYFCERREFLIFTCTNSPLNHLKDLNFLHLLSDGNKYVNQYSSGGGFSFSPKNKSE